MCIFLIPDNNIGRAYGGGGPDISSSHVAHPAAPTRRQGAFAHHALHGRGGHPGRPQGRHLQRQIALRRHLSIPQEQIRNRLSFDTCFGR